MIQRISVVLAILLLPPSSACWGQTRVWNKIVTDNWNSAANWTNGLPNSGVDAWINNGGTVDLYHSSFFGVGQVRDLYIGLFDGVSFPSTGILNVYRLNNSDPGSLQSRKAFVGHTSYGAASVRRDSTWTISDDLIVGFQAQGSFLIDNAGVVSSARGFIGDFDSADGWVAVDGVGSTWTNSGELRVGNLGKGELVIFGGGAVSNTIGYIGFSNSFPDIGSASVDGLGSTWTNSSELFVGRAGRGTLSVTGGGAVANTNGYIGDFGGTFPNVGGTATVDGLNSKWTNSGTLWVGNQGPGTLNVQNGGEVSNTFASIGRLAFVGSAGTANVSGAGSKWTNSATLIVGEAGTGALNIQSGGAVSDSLAFVGFCDCGSGAVSVDGAGSRWTTGGDLLLGYRGTATMSVTGGGAVLNNDGIIGDFDSATATATVDGVGSTWTNSGELRVGNQGTGTLNIQNGGVVFAYSSYVGHNNALADLGSVTVDGPGSQWNNTFELYVGRAGRGSLSITGGGRVTDTNGIVGYAPALLESTDLVTVDGNGSTWSNSNFLFVGHESAGELLIRNAGAVSSANGVIATSTGSTGTITVDGAGSTWTNSAHTRVGWNGSGVLSIRNGGVASSNSAVIADGVGSQGAVNVAGAGSAWAINTTLDVGNQGTGILTVQNGAVVSATGGVNVKTQGTVLGDGTIVASVTNSGVVTPGTSPGTLRITGNYTQAAAGELQIELASSGSFDKLAVTNHVSLNGDLTVSLIDGFTPSAGQSFDFLDWGSLAGTFAQLDLPVLGGPLTWDDSQLYTNGVLTVTGPGLLGDYNQNGVVDAADYSVWRDRLSSGTSLPNDNTLGVGTDDYNRWKANFRAMAGSGSALPSAEPLSAAVPEPGTYALVCLSLLGVVVLHESSFRNLRSACAFITKGSNDE